MSQAVPPPYGPQFPDPRWQSFGPPTQASLNAPWIKRVAGAVVDGVITLAAQTPGSFGLGLLIVSTTKAKRADGSTSVQVVDHGVFAAGLILAIVVYLVVLAFVTWNLVVRQGRTGQSLGKQIIGIRVVKEATRQPLGGWLTLGRLCLHALDFLACCLGWLWPLWDARRQTFADKIASSVVVNTPSVLTAIPTAPS